MIIRRVRVHNWRSIRQLEMAPHPGLNVVTGANEAGKSSLAEALEWALFHDILSPHIQNSALENLDNPLWPGSNPAVELELETSGGTLRLVKTLGREMSCRTVCLEFTDSKGQTNQWHQQQAQTRWTRLWAGGSDLETPADELAGPAVLISRQGRGEPLFRPAANLFHTLLTVGDDGRLGLGSRLESVRRRLEGGEVVPIFGPYLDSTKAPAGTKFNAERQLAQAREELSHWERVLRELSDLRTESTRLAGAVSAARQEEGRLQSEITALESRAAAQTAAERFISQIQAFLHWTESHLEHAGRRNKRRAVLFKKREECVGAQSIQPEPGDVEAARAQLEESKSRLAALQAELDTIGLESEAWSAYLRVFESREHLHRWRKAVADLETAEHEWMLAREALAALELPPAHRELAALHQALSQLAIQEAAADNHITVEFTRDGDQAAVVQVDEGEEFSLPLSPGHTETLGALERIHLRIAGVGDVDVRGGEHGVEERRSALQLAREQVLACWTACGAGELPALEEAMAQLALWQEKRDGYDAAEQAVIAAHQAMLQEVARSAQLPEAKLRRDEAEAEFNGAREHCASYAEIIPLGGRGRADVAEAHAQCARQYKALGALLIQARNGVHEAEMRLRTAEEKASQLALERAEAAATLRQIDEELEALAAEERAEKRPGADFGELLRELGFPANVAPDVWKLRQMERQKRSERAALGTSVTPWNLGDVQKQLAHARQDLAEKEERLRDVNAQISAHCQMDPAGQWALAKRRCRIWEQRAVGYRALEQGAELLRSVIMEEQTNLEPLLESLLQECAGKWLSDLRGAPTRLVLDKETAKISHVETQVGNEFFRLKLGSVSAGTREQIALVLRLALAERAARRMGHDRIPLILDDPLTQSDVHRSGVLAPLLQEASQKLQLFFFTCHDPNLSGVEGRWHAMDKGHIASARELA